jgi:hypothetical protein
VRMIYSTVGWSRLFSETHSVLFEWPLAVM